MHHGKDGRHMFNEIFTNKTVFVTGHTGFIGSWVCSWLHLLGAKVIGYSLSPNTVPSMFKIINLEKKIVSIIGDINDKKHLENSLIQNQPDFVFHLAAQPLVKESYEKPFETFQTNVMGSLNILEAIRNVDSVKICVMMTSDKCYENKEIHYAYKENDSLGGHDPYSASKGAAEIVISSYRNSFFNPSNFLKHKKSVATIRAGNVIGGGDWAKDRIIPDCIRALIDNNPIFVRSPTSIRPWQHVLESVSGMLNLAAKMWENPKDFSGPWNLGPTSSNKTYHVKDMVNLLIKNWGSGNWESISEKIQKHEANILILDTTKVNTMLKWMPVYNTEDAIKETVAWYKAYQMNEHSDITEKQIQNYIEKAKQKNISWAMG